MFLLFMNRKYRYRAEYIVGFSGYYRTEARRRFLEAALADSGVLRWAVLPRHNPAADYPSDFDVIQVLLRGIALG